jgi:hypothetical protein
MLCARITRASLIAFVTALMLPPCSSGAERRCDELEENCVCSEPLNGHPPSHWFFLVQSK